ncbi:MAG: hypothetical protein K2L51_05590 [Clostridiales bacterium]|nr:hypothetical protein [Clostridiales bacterium]
MDFATLTPVEVFSMPFFDDMPTVPPMPANDYYKIYHDGGHYVAIDSSGYCKRKQYGVRDRKKKDIDILFDSMYEQARKEGLRDKKHSSDKPLTDYIKAGMCKLFDDTPDLDEYIAKKIKRKLNNVLHRKKRFRRKGFLNRWTHFVTWTYDDRKHTEETFRKKLRKCLSNLHTRRGWRFMGVFEHAPDTGRLHFHGLVYIPDGEMLGKIYEREDYSTALHKMQITHPNTFFEENFGRCDFEELTDMKLRHGNTMEYILKYIDKTGERIVYSRGIPTEIVKQIPKTEILSEFTDFVTKFVLADTAVDWYTDIAHYTRAKQMSITDLLCNPLQVA